MRVKIRLPETVVRLWAAVKNNWLLGISVLISLIALLLSEAAHENQTWRSAAHVLIASYCIIVLFFITWKMIEKTRYGNFSINLSLIAATVTALLLRQYWTAIALIIVYCINELLAKFGIAQSQKQLNLLISTRPHSATLLKGRKNNQVTVRQIQRGDKILIAPGEIVPVDCEITEGGTELDERLFTGEQEPVKKTVGDYLFAGSLNIAGVVTAKALQTEENSRYEKLIKIMKSSSQGKAPFERQAERFVVPFTALSLMIAGGTWLLSHDSGRFLKVLVVATPSGLLLGSVIGIRAGLAKSAENGIFIKSGRALENLANLAVMAFDKVGIITSGQAKIGEVHSFSRNYKKSEILVMAASLTLNQQSPTAEANVAAARKQNLRLIKPRGLEVEIDQGIRGMIGSQQVWFGNEAYLKNHEFKLPKEASKIEGLLCLLAIDDEIVGAISYNENPNPEAETFIEIVNKSVFTDSLLITSDSQKLANEIAAKNNISSVMAECSPANKITFIENIPDTSRPFGFVGDGQADALMLSAADVGIAINCQANEHAGDSSNVIILQNDILKAAGSLSTARLSLGRAQLAVAIGVLLSLGLMGLFATGKIRSIYGPFLLIPIDLLVIATALQSKSLALRQKTQQTYNTKRQTNIVEA